MKAAVGYSPNDRRLGDRPTLRILDGFEDAAQRRFLKVAVPPDGH